MTHDVLFSLYEIQSFLIEMMQDFRFDLPDSKPKVRYGMCCSYGKVDADVFPFHA
jgi:hypothetical protein